MDGWKIGFGIYMIFSLLLVAFTVSGPVAALMGWNDAASGFYRAGEPLCHQWVYRSYCIFDTGKGWMVDDCIPANYNGTIIETTKFTPASHSWDGVFKYSTVQIGRNRAEMVERDGMVGYKMVACARDTAIYVGMLFAGFAFLYLRRFIKETPTLWFLLIGLIPMGIDGTAQLFGFWESSNPMRFATGFLAGAFIGFYLVSLLSDVLTRAKGTTRKKFGHK